MDTRYMAAEHARGMSEILTAMAESPTQPTADFYSVMAAMADMVAREAEGAQSVCLFDAKAVAAAS